MQPMPCTLAWLATRERADRPLNMDPRVFLASLFRACRELSPRLAARSDLVLHVTPSTGGCVEGELWGGVDLLQSYVRCRCPGCVAAPESVAWQHCQASCIGIRTG